MENFIFYYYFFFCILFFFSFLKKCSCLDDYILPHSFNLLNGNILIIHSQGIVIYDSSLTTIIKQYNISNLIPENDDYFLSTFLSKIEINRFPVNENGYIIIIIDKKFYIFDFLGNFKYKSPNNETTLNGNYYTLIPIHKKNNDYIYMVGFIEQSIINLIFYKYNDSLIEQIETINLDKSNISEYSCNCQSKFIEGVGLSCQLMSNFTEKIIVCFINLKDPSILTNFFINAQNYTLIKSENSSINIHNHIKAIKSVTNLQKKKSLICYTFADKPSNCIIYSIENNSFSEIKNYEVECGGDYFYKFHLYYMIKKDQILYFCDYSNKFNLVILDENFTKVGYFNINSITNIKSIFFVYSFNLSNYYGISYTSDNNNNYYKFFKINLTQYIENPDISNTNTIISTTEPIEVQESENTYFTESTEEQKTENTYSNVSTTEIVITTNINSNNFDSTIITQRPSVDTTILQSIISTNLDLEKTKPISILTYLENEIISTTNIISNIISNSPKIEILNVTKDEFMNEIPSIIYKIENSKIYEKIGDDFTVLIYPTNSTFLTSTTHVDFNECEEVLREYYHLPESSMITFLQIEIENENSNSLINQVEYQVYSENKTKLDLSLCKDVNIQVYYSIKNNSKIDLNSANSFKKSGIDIFNINDSFFNDICEPYSYDFDDDLILEDRIKYVYQNYSLCEEGCIYDKIDLENMSIACNCKVKENITTVLTPIHIEYSEGSSTNFDVIKCYKLVFSLNGKDKNIGFWILTILVTAHGPILVYYFNKGIKPVKEYILNQMEEYGYIKKNKKQNIKNNNFKKVKNKLGKKESAPPPKNKKELQNKNKKYGKKGKLTIKNLKIIDNSSSINIIGSRDIIPDVNKNKKSNKAFKTINENESMSINENKNPKIKKKIKKKVKSILLTSKTSKSELNKKTKLSKIKSVKTKNMTFLPTQGIEDKPNTKNINSFTLMNIDLNLIHNKNYIPPDSYIILNNYTFEEALKYDKRQTCEIFYIFALSKQIIFHTFLYRSPIELFPLRLILFIFIISSDLALNALFYFNDNISKKYRSAKNLFLFTFSDNITVVILSTFVGFILLTLLAKLSNSTNAIREVFMKEEEKIKKNKNYTVTEQRKNEILEEIEQVLKKYKIKVIILIIIELILILFFWYFVTAFCHVYKATQTSWLIDSCLSILARGIIELLICLGLAKLYILAITGESSCLYNFIMFLYNFG